MSGSQTPTLLIPGRRIAKPATPPDVFVLGAIAFLILLTLVSVAAPLISPADPLKQDLLHRFAGPGTGGHLLGTDEAGRDVLSRLLYGARASLLAGLQASVIAATVGISLGLLAGYVGGWTDRVLNLLNDALMSLPGIVLALAFIAVLGPGIHNAMTAVGIVFVPRFYRMTRATARSTRESTFVEALRAMGASTPRIIGKHVLPNIAGPIIVEGTIVMSAAILAEASLSFLGLGVQPPDPSWGAMLSTGMSRPDALHLVYPPGVLLSLTMLSVAILGDHLRDVVSGATTKGKG